MSHPYGALPYGLLHRDMLQIAVEHDFSKIMHRFYAWLVVNANPYSFEIYGNPTVVDIAYLLKTNKQSLYNIRDAFVDWELINQEVGVHGLKCVVNHVKQARMEIKAEKALDEDYLHPYGNMQAGKMPREFLRIAVEANNGKGLGKFPQRLFWYITFNLAEAGHLTRFDEIKDIGKHIGTPRMKTILKSFRELEKTNAFSIKSPSSIQGKCEIVVAAMAEATEQKRKKEEQQAYRAAMIAFLKRQERIYANKFWQPGQRAPKPHANHVKEMKAAFRRHYEETGEFLTEYF